MNTIERYKAQKDITDRYISGNRAENATDSYILVKQHERYNKIDFDSFESAIVADIKRQIAKDLKSIEL